MVFAKAVTKVKLPACHGQKLQLGVAPGDMVLLHAAFVVPPSLQHEHRSSIVVLVVFSPSRSATFICLT